MARRSRKPRTRPQPRSQPSQTPSSPKSSKPSHKSARIASQSAPRIFRPSAPIIEEISFSSTEGFSSSDSVNNSFKQGTPVFSESSEDQGPQKATSKPALKPSPAKTPLKRKPKTAPLPEATTSVPPPKRPKKFTPSPMSDKHAQLLKRNVVRGKVVNVGFLRNRVWGCC